MNWKIATLGAFVALGILAIMMDCAKRSGMDDRIVQLEEGRLGSSRR